MKLESLAVVGGGVADVVVPAVAGVALGEACHQAVADDFGDDGGAGDGVALAIAFDDGEVISELGLGTAIDEDGVRYNGQVAEGALHGEAGGAADVEALDLTGRRGAHADAEGPLADGRGDLFAL